MERGYIKAKVVEDWWSELGEKSSLEWFKKVKEDFGIEEVCEGVG